MGGSWRRGIFAVLALAALGADGEPSLHGAKRVGELRATHKEPYQILSGRGCGECDANLAIYIHSPSDGPLGDEAHAQRFHYPGRLLSREDGGPLYQSRMLFGDCLAAHPNAVVWFERERAAGGKWAESVLIAQVRGDELVTQRLTEKLPRKAEVLRAMLAHTCSELAGVDAYEEP
jgi:hypothetical protein